VSGLREVRTGLAMYITVLWDMTPCRLVMPVVSDVTSEALYSLDLMHSITGNFLSGKNPAVESERDALNHDVCHATIRGCGRQYTPNLDVGHDAVRG